jgi:TolB protein
MKKERLNIIGALMLLMVSAALMIGCTKSDGDEDENGDGTVKVLTGKLAFVSYDNGDGEIYTMNADGKNLTQLTNNEANDVQPSWSPDGSKIAYNSFGHNMPSEIFTMKADGSGITQITHDPAETVFGEEWPSWSPDGTKIVYESFKDASTESNGTTIQNANLYVSASNGSGGDLRISSHLFYEGNPSWSPDGSKIAFVHAQVDTIGENLYTSGYQIWVMDAGGSNWNKLTSTGSNNIRPKWSPDGSKIVYQADEGICVVAPGGDYQNLVSYGGNPSWSPDGTKIIFDGDNEIYVMDADGKNVRKIAASMGARQVVWTE